MVVPRAKSFLLCFVFAKILNLIDLNNLKKPATSGWFFYKNPPNKRRRMTNIISWQGRQDLNSRHLVLETSALPTELRP